MRGMYEQMQGQKFSCILRRLFTENSMLPVLSCCTGVKVYL
jgi:hypothetical protein